MPFLESIFPRYPLFYVSPHPLFPFFDEFRFFEDVHLDLLGDHDYAIRPSDNPITRSHSYLIDELTG